MARKSDLRVQRTNTVINSISSLQEKALTRALRTVQSRLSEEFPGLLLQHEPQWRLSDVVGRLRTSFPEVDFHYYFASSAMRPDGGILSILSKKQVAYPILITEKKNQGTNDLRIAEGKGKQAKGNAIERLGKNVIGFRTAMKMETIFPFVCFGDGCDFEDSSSILGRVVTIAQFGHLNKEYLHHVGGHSEFDRGTFYFRVEPWTEQEMAELASNIAINSVYYYFSKYGKSSFI